MHSNVELATVEVNANDGAVPFVAAGGPPVISVSGVGVPLGATVNVRVAGAEPLPARSVAEVKNVYVPAPSAL